MRGYDLYKTVFEASQIGGLRQFVPPGSTVIDVGANIGFFSRRFARWVAEGGRVVAIEPEPENCRRLRRALAAQGVEHVVEVVEAVAAESAGSRTLEINPTIPATTASASAESRSPPSPSTRCSRKGAGPRSP